MSRNAEDWFLFRMSRFVLEMFADLDFSRCCKGLVLTIH